MKPSDLLAHRGLWNDRKEQNSRAAIADALKSGFGLETDLRDEGSQIVISHDPPGWPRPLGTCQEASRLNLDELFEIYRSCDSNGWLALNIKADGLAGEIKSRLDRFGIKRYFIFDMSIPDQIGYEQLGMVVFQRVSERESEIGLKTCRPYIRGIWLDSFESIWFGPDQIEHWLCDGLDVCIVSPELHNRDCQTIWPIVDHLNGQQLGLEKDSTGTLTICTDVPNVYWKNLISRST